MAKVVWADPAIHDLDAVADYIAMENETAARELVRRLGRFPRMGSVPSELHDLQYRQLVVSPCRIFYRVEKKTIYIVHVLRGE